MLVQDEVLGSGFWVLGSKKHWCSKCKSMCDKHEGSDTVDNKEKNTHTHTKQLMSCMNWHRASPPKIINMVRLRRALLKCLSQPSLSNGFIG